MKSALLIVVVCAINLAFAVPKIVSPQAGETVVLHSPKCLELLAITNVQERAKFLRSNSTSEILQPLPVVAEWVGAGEAEVTVTEEGSARPFVTGHSTSNRLEVWNLKVATRYELQVVQDCETAAVRFVTADHAPRFIRIPRHEEGGVSYRGVPNMRDIGGRMMPGGRRVRQGLVYRSSGLNNNANEIIYTHEEILALYRSGELARRTESNAKNYLKAIEAGTFGTNTPMRLVKSAPTLPGTPRLNEFWKAYLCDTLGVRTDIDLRKDAEVFGMTGSPLGERVRFFREWSNYEAYDMVHSNGLAATKAIFRQFMNRENYPIDFHCIAGADRTGTVATLLHGILGASDNQIWEDYQLTGRVVNDERHLGWFTAFVKSMDAYPGETLSARICEYFRQRCGFSSEELDRIRMILLEPETKDDKDVVR